MRIGSDNPSKYKNWKVLETVLVRRGLKQYTVRDSKKTIITLLKG